MCRLSLSFYLTNDNVLENLIYYILIDRNMYRLKTFVIYKASIAIQLKVFCSYFSLNVLSKLSK